MQALNCGVKLSKVRSYQCLLEDPQELLVVLLGYQELIYLHWVSIQILQSTVWLDMPVVRRHEKQSSCWAGDIKGLLDLSLRTGCHHLKKKYSSHISSLFIFILPCFFEYTVSLVLMIGVLKRTENYRELRTAESSGVKSHPNVASFHARRNLMSPCW